MKIPATREECLEELFYLRQRCFFLGGEVGRLEKEKSDAINLMMKGEAVREKVMLELAMMLPSKKEGG